MAKLTAKEERMVEQHLNNRMAEKTGPRERSLPNNWTPPDSKPHLSKSEAKQVDAALRDVMRPNKPLD